MCEEAELYVALSSVRAVSSAVTGESPVCTSIQNKPLLPKCSASILFTCKPLIAPVRLTHIKLSIFKIAVIQMLLFTVLAQALPLHGRQRFHAHGFLHRRLLVLARGLGSVVRARLSGQGQGQLEG